MSKDVRSSLARYLKSVDQEKVHLDLLENTDAVKHILEYRLSNSLAMTNAHITTSRYYFTVFVAIIGFSIGSLDWNIWFGLSIFTIILGFLAELFNTRAAMREANAIYGLANTNASLKIFEVIFFVINHKLNKKILIITNKLIPYIWVFTPLFWLIGILTEFSNNFICYSIKNHTIYWLNIIFLVLPHTILYIKDRYEKFISTAFQEFSEKNNDSIFLPTKTSRY